MKRAVTVVIVSQPVIGLGVAMIVNAKLGVDPWTVFMQGCQNVTGLSLGRISQLTTAVLVIVNYLLGGEVPGLGTLFNVILVGWSIDFFMPLVAVRGGSLAFRLALLLGGIVLMAGGIAAYARANMGRGPLDGWAFTVGKLLKMDIGSARVATDFLSVCVGFLLKGEVGIGTLIAAVLTGPLLRFFLTYEPSGG